MISWSSSIYGAALSAGVAAVLVGLIARGYRVSAALSGATGAAVGPIAWNAILRATDGTQFFHDAPISVMPASWQDTGSSVFALAAAALLIGAGPAGKLPARRAIVYALAAAVAAFLVDVYLY